MHPEAYGFVAAHALAGAGRRVVEFGSRDVNGTPRGLFPGAEYVGVDIEDGPGVDLVADAAAWRTRRKFDVAVCCEVLEHTFDAEEIVASAWLALRKGGLFIVTAATDPRLPHSAVDGCQVREGEWYCNIHPAELEGWLSAGWRDVTIDVDVGHGDVYATATKG